MPLSSQIARLSKDFNLFQSNSKEFKAENRHPVAKYA
jgi:hypothetical protein